MSDFSCNFCPSAITESLQSFMKGEGLLLHLNLESKRKYLLKQIIAIKTCETHRDVKESKKVILYEVCETSLSHTSSENFFFKKLNCSRLVSDS